MRLPVVLVAIVATLAACGMPEQSSNPATLSVLEPTSAPGGQTPQPNIERLTASAVGEALASATVEPSLSVPLEVVDGKFLGIGVGSFLSDALSVLGVAAVVEHASQLGAEAADTAATLSPCSSASNDHWVMHANGLTLLFEGPSAEQAQLTNWVYRGGPASGFTEMVAPKGITIGGTRPEILSAYKQAEDFGDSIEVAEPVNLWFGLNGNSVISFGASDCGG